MLISWLRDESIESLTKLGQNEGWIISSEEILKTKHRFPYLCYGAYDNDRFVGGITGYLHEKSAWIGNFIVDKEYRNQGIGKKLFSTLLKALKTDKDSIFLHSATTAVEFYEKFGFSKTREICRMLYETNMNKSNNKSFLSDYQQDSTRWYAYKFDKKFFDEDRSDFLIEDMNTKSSLLLSCENGFCHSKAIERDIMIGAWEMQQGAYLDAERMLQTTLSIRGQKNIFADFASDNIDAKSLYEQYGFKISGVSVAMCLGKPLKIQYDNIYAFGSLGSKG